MKQPWADLIMAGQKTVENRSWRVPSTLPQWWRCGCGHRTRFAPEVTNARHVHGDVAAADPMEPDGPLPFTLGIHAAAKVQWRRGADATRSDLLVAWSQWSTRAKPALGYPVTATVPLTGVLLGTVTVTGCHHADECWEWCDCSPSGTCTHSGGCSRWAEPGCWHWTLTDPLPIDVPVPKKGRQGLWTVDDSALPTEVSA